jgi:hypothetical protein
MQRSMRITPGSLDPPTPRLDLMLAASPAPDAKGVADDDGGNSVDAGGATVLETRGENGDIVFDTACDFADRC